ncbi:hypothetical protein AQF52_7106 [Streptomyces venezuelae]|nr:hypothetical protein AQF52_7106 [Streptomyces venezuelae]
MTGAITLHRVPARAGSSDPPREAGHRHPPRLAPRRTDPRTPSRWHGDGSPAGPETTEHPIEV